jgi:hypothetical protein
MKKLALSAVATALLLGSVAFATAAETSPGTKCRSMAAKGAIPAHRDMLPGMKCRCTEAKRATPAHRDTPPATSNVGVAFIRSGYRPSRGRLRQYGLASTELRPSRGQIACLGLEPLADDAGALLAVGRAKSGASCRLTLDALKR